MNAAHRAMDGSSGSGVTRVPCLGPKTAVWAFCPVKAAKTIPKQKKELTTALLFPLESLGGG